MNTVPLVCVCDIARPSPEWGGECVDCLRPVVALWPPHRYRQALAAYPQVANQVIDWSLRRVEAAS